MHKITFILLLTLISSIVNASDLIQVMDGRWASCDSRHDVFRSKSKGFFRFTNPKIEVKKSTVELELSIDLLECVKIKNKYYYKKLNSLSPVTYKIISENGYVDVTREDKRREVIATDYDTKIIGRARINKVNGNFKVIISMPINKLEDNTFPAAQQYGDYFVNLSMLSLRRYTTESYDSGFGLNGSAMYRLFLDLDKQKAVFK